MGALLVGIEIVTSLINRCKIYELLYLQNERPGQAEENLQLALVRLYTALLEFLAKARRLYQASVMRFLHGFLEHNDITGFVDKCQALANEVDTDASNCSRLHSQASASQLHLLLTDLQQPVMRTDASVAALYEDMNESERLKILQWLSHIPYEANHYAACQGRTVGTGQWLLKHDLFGDWRKSSASTILWLHGIRKWHNIVYVELFDKFLP